MKLIDSGLQYNVYDLGDGRVRKTPTSLPHRYKTMRSWGEENSPFRHPIRLIKLLIDSEIWMRSSFRGFKDRIYDIDAKLIGNPVFYSKYEYEQDKVISLGSAMKQTSLEGKKQLIDGYFENTLKCWEYGFSDIVFNFSWNNGVTADGKVILTDLGEVSWRKDVVSGFIKKNHILNQASYNRLTDVALKDYIARRQSEVFTLKNLEQHWRKAI